MNYNILFVYITGNFEEKDNCRCVSDTSDGLITIKCQLPKTTNQTSEKPKGNYNTNLQLKYGYYKSFKIIKLKMVNTFFFQ